LSRAEHRKRWMAEKVRRLRRKRRIRSFPGLGSFPFLRHKLSPTRLAVVVSSIVIGFALGLIFLSYGSKLYKSWHEARLLQHASSMLQQHEYSGAIRSVEKALASNRHPLPALQILAGATEIKTRSEAAA